MAYSKSSQTEVLEGGLIMKRKGVKLGLTLALACLALISLSACGNKAAQSQPQVVEVSRGNITVSVAADGNVSLLRQRELRFGTSGTITKINVEQGDRVAEGQELARLDTTPLEEMVTTAELAVKAAEIDLELATNNYLKLITPYPYLTYRFVLPESVDAIRTAERQIKEAQTELLKGLQGQPYSMAEIQDQLGKAQESLSETETKLAWGLDEGVRPVDIEYWTLRAAQLQMEKTQVALDNTKNELNKVQNQLEKAVIVAPFDGVIATVKVEEGDVLSSVNYATTTIIELIDPSRMELKTKVDEVDIPSVKLGQKAIIKLDALPDLKLEGTVTAISLLPSEEGGVVLYEVKIGFDVPESSGLRGGMTATADVVTDERSNALLVPNRAIRQDSSGNPVVKIMVGDQTQERAVVTGISDGLQTEIISGLNEGDRVVIESRAGTGLPSLLGG
jgi:multidrug efflux pump subunit AcrA (membrane-fusion protein)